MKMSKCYRCRREDVFPLDMRGNYCKECYAVVEARHKNVCLKCGAPRDVCSC